MPKGPQGQKRPADVAQCAHRVFQIAIGEAEEDAPPSRKRNSGLAGAAARVTVLTKEQRSGIAKKAAEARWK